MQTSGVPPEIVEGVTILDNTIATVVTNAETGLRPIAQYILRYSVNGTSGNGDSTNTQPASTPPSGGHGAGNVDESASAQQRSVGRD